MRIERSAQFTRADEKHETPDGLHFAGNCMDMVVVGEYFGQHTENRELEKSE